MDPLTNSERAAYGARAIGQGTPDAAENDPQENLTDTLANMMHAAAESEDLDFDAALASAEQHFSAESDR